LLRSRGGEPPLLRNKRLKFKHYSLKIQVPLCDHRLWRCAIAAQ
jgi:hypothetical protein